MDEKKMTVALLQKCEGMRFKAYDDGYGNLTIGIGIAHKYPNGALIQKNDICTFPQAYQYLNEYLDKNVYPVIDELKKQFNFNEHVYAALCSFYFNCNKIGPSIKRALKNSNLKDLSDAMKLSVMVYNHKTGNFERSNGLYNRRIIETDYFLNGASL